jgi:hypothetical protein
MAIQEIKLGQSEVTENVPTLPFKVIASQIPFYTDEDCENEVNDARIVIVKALDPDDEIQELDIMPSTQEYQSGQYVTLGLEHKRVWDACWYRDPENGEVTQAWKVHVNFIGEVISPSAFEKDKNRIQDLEKRTMEKLDQISRAKRTSVN